MSKKPPVPSPDRVAQRLAQFRQGAPLKTLNARTLVALTSNPGCNARRVLDAASIDTSKVAAKLGKQRPEGQSLFALMRGNRFEADVKAQGYEALIRLLREEGFSVPEPRVLPLRDRYPLSRKAPLQTLALRAAVTREAVLAMAKGDPEACNIIDGGALQWDYGGLSARLETDGIAWQMGGCIHVIEIKSFPIVDGQADPAKVGAAAMQAAIYVAALEDLLQEGGLDTSRVAKQILLICPRNTGLMPMLTRVDVTRHVRSLRRLMQGRASIEQLLEALEPGTSLSTEGMSEEEAAQHIASVLDVLGTNYLPECLDSCPFATHCREQAQTGGDPACLGVGARANLGTVNLFRLIELSQGAPAAEEEQDVAAMSQQARRLLHVIRSSEATNRRGAA